MSRLFLATEASLHRQVVIKVLPPELASEVSAARFKQEIELAARLQHPNILPVLTAGAKDDLLFYVMPFVSGESLRHRLTRQGKLPVADVVRILHEVADALAFAHAEGVIHRDIKPENILLEGSHAVLTDFGVARALTEARSGGRLTETGVSVGTPAYMSPEQAAGERHIDASADVYALAVVGYEMLAGMPPFKGPTAQAVIAAHITATPRSLGDVCPETPPEIEQTIMRSLAKDPSARLRTAAEFRDALVARPAAASSPGRRFPVLAGAAALIILAAYGVFSGTRGRRQKADASPQEMLVVLPFVNLGTSGDEYFADGMTEELTARLATIHGFGVISRTSAVRYRKTDKPLKQIGQELGVNYVLEGTIRTERSPGRANRVRVSPQLIRVSDDTHLWAEIYDEALADVFQVQSSIASRVAAALNIALLEGERRALESRPTANLEAYGYYLRGNEYLNRSVQVEGNLRSAVAMFEKATSLDSTFALAFAKLSFAHNDLFWFFDSSEEQLIAAKRAADRALRLNGDLPEGHLALGYYYYHGHLDYDRALEQFALAQRGQPSNSDVWASIAFVQRRQGKWKEAVTSLTKATQLDPRSNDYAEELGETYLAMHDYQQAESLFNRAQSLAPDWALIYVWKAWLYLLWNGDVRRAQQVLEEASREVSREDLVLSAAWVFPGGRIVRLLGPDYTAKIAGFSLHSFRTDSASYYVSQAWFNALIKRPQLARAYFDSARIVLEVRVRKQPEDAFAHATLSQVYANLGRKADAIREGTEAVAVVPTSKDAYFGPWMVWNLAEIYVMVGEYDAAIDRLGSVIGAPGCITVPLLERDPIWAPVRGNPKLAKLLEAKR